MFKNISTKASNDLDKKEVKKENEKLLEQIIGYQKKMNAEGKHSLLIVLQGMDAAGKSGAARVLAGVNPSGIKVKSFKKPTDNEAAHDFLWRVHQHTPAKGMIQIFDRSHYEDILVPSVGMYIPEKKVEERYDIINNFEKLLEHSGTTILKFYLHVSKDKQEERLMERVTNSEKHHKHNDGDWDTRAKWDEYMGVYKSVFKKCNEVSWQIIPSDNNWYKENLIGKAIVSAFESMNMEWPKLDSEKFNS
jgi:PPK2 family polyphosphate:nucleotide phosphotransferase